MRYLSSIMLGVCLAVIILVMWLLLQPADAAEPTQKETDEVFAQCLVKKRGDMYATVTCQHEAMRYGLTAPSSYVLPPVIRLEVIIRYR
jgi:hypothetical protein